MPDAIIIRNHNITTKQYGPDGSTFLCHDGIAIFDSDNYSSFLANDNASATSSVGHAGVDRYYDNEKCVAEEEHSHVNSEPSTQSCTNTCTNIVFLDAVKALLADIAGVVEGLPAALTGVDGDHVGLDDGSCDDPKNPRMMTLQEWGVPSQLGTKYQTTTMTFHPIHY